MSFVYKRYPQAFEPSSYPIADPSYMPAGPEAAPTLTGAAIATPTVTTQSTLSIGGLPTASAAYLASLLSFIGLLALAFVIWKVRGWWTRRNSGASDEDVVEKGDEEAQPPNRPVIPVVSQAGVRWQPQIRSISGPVLKETEKRAPPPKRVRSPLLTRSYSAKNRDPFADPYPKSAPATAVSFTDDMLRPPQRGSRGEMMSPPVSPHALAASGMQTRSLARSSQLSKDVDA